MSDLLEKILDEVKALRAEVAELRGAASVHPFESLPHDAVVGKDYVAYRFGCSERAVRAGERGTDQIKRVSNKPLKFIRRDVDEIFRKINRNPKEIATHFKHTARPVRRKSIIKKVVAQ